ncbi:MAG: type II toxin-antitoxin system HicB family antitoxin [Imperialibacter sp.]|uniref:type II toxin-antitoxin system HicB family antitoxin n=1 Tax=Imperialibacter sp. TaxID=2038411 RepID=UPI0032EB2CD5
MKLTAIIEKAEDGWYVGQIEEVPAAISQGKTIEELKSSLVDALKLLWDADTIKK